LRDDAPLMRTLLMLGDQESKSSPVSKVQTLMSISSDL
jgi:hypothetical protein